MYDHLIFENLVYDIARRNPRSQIIFNGFYYYLYNGSTKVPVKNTHVEELISRNFATKNKQGGLEITESAVEFSDCLLTVMKVENHGKTFERMIAPKPYGEI